MLAERFTGWGWPSLGLTGSLAIAAASPSVFGAAWWFRLGIAHGAAEVLFYVGVALLCGAWLGLGRTLQGPSPPATSRLTLIGALWTVPLAVGPPLFSHDVYSYLAQGEIQHLGLNPYTHSPHVLAALGQSHLLAGVSPFWRHTTSPYGPLFLALAGLIAGAVGSHVIAGVLLLRGLELAGVALLAVYVPRLARVLGSDPARATWLAVISPLVLLQLIAAGHNDALMAGLLVAGVTLALERRPLLGVVACALAATIKLPAAAGLVFIALAWMRTEESRADAARVLALSLAATVAVLAAVSLGTGLDTSWLTAGVLSTPGRVHLSITPTTAGAWSIATPLHLLGVHVKAWSIASALSTVVLSASAVLALWLLRRARYANLVPGLATLLLVSVFAGPATWPWYLTWGLALMACWEPAQRVRELPLVFVLAAVLVQPGGVFALPRQAAPAVLAFYVAAGIVAWRRRREHGLHRSQQGWHRMAAPEQPALTNF